MEGCDSPFGKTVASDDFISLRIPHHKLEACLVFQIEMIKIALSAASASYGTKGNFTKSSDLTKYIRCILVIYYIYFIATMVGCTKKSLFIKFALEQSDVYRFNDWRYHLVTCLKDIRCP